MGNPTLKDIAKVANVSITTVSKALANHSDISEKTKLEIKRICDEVNYVPNSVASNLRKNTTRFIGVIITDSANPYFASFLKSIETKLSKNKYYTIIFNSNEDEKKELEIIKELRLMRVAGIIITPTCAENIEFLRDTGIPFVLAHRYITKKTDNYVIADDEQAGFVATEAILENNSSQTIFFLGHNIALSSVSDRLKGYTNALNDNKIALNSENVYLNLYSNEDGYKVTLKILQKFKPPYSFVCYSDYIATGVLKALFEKNILVPDMARVMGIDNVELFRFAHPMLSTIDIPKDKMGIACVDILKELIIAKKGKKEIKEQHIVFSTKLILNNTC